MKKLTSLIFTTSTFAINVGISSHTNEFSIVESKYARELFLSLPVKNTYADLVNGLIFKYHEFIFCVREPSRQFHCHIYLNGKGTGKLSSFHKDTDFGKGTILEFLSTKKLNSNADITYSNNRLRIKFEDKMAKRFWEKLDLIPESYRQIAGRKIEARKGEMLNCINDNGKFTCQFNIPINKEKKIKLPEFL